MGSAIGTFFGNHRRQRSTGMRPEGMGPESMRPGLQGMRPESMRPGLQRRQSRAHLSEESRKRVLSKKYALIPDNYTSLDQVKF